MKKKISKVKYGTLGVVTHIFNPSTSEFEASLVNM